MTQPSILIVDDNSDNFDVIDTLLLSEKYETHYASSGQKALDRLDSLNPDLILLDVMMPEMDGIEVCQIIRQNPQYQALPIIMVTALSSSEDLARCLSAGADDFISKPINAIELRARVKAMLRIKKQYDSLQAALKLRQDLSQMVIHDLRNPLTVIISLCELLKGDLSIVQKNKKIQQLMTAGLRLNSMLDSLLLMAKIEAHQLNVDLKLINPQIILLSVIEDFNFFASQKQITLTSDLPDQFLEIYLDPSLFRRILDNLIINALKFSPRKSMITLALSYDNQYCKIAVIDQGIGITDDIKKVLFEKFSIGQQMENIPQTGLGLAFCKMAIEAHQGTITVEDNHPQGAIFIVKIPLKINSLDG